MLPTRSRSVRNLPPALPTAASHVLGLLCALGLPIAANAQGSASQPAATLPAAVQTFQRRPTAEQERALAALQEDLAGTSNAYLQAMRTIADSAVLGGDERHPRFAAHHGKRPQALDEAADAILPMTVQYVFGVGAIDPLDTPAAPAGKKLDKGALERLATEGQKARRSIVIQQALLGFAPDADRALAALLQDLDHDTGGDRFAAFLHAWRNGPESFYEALDRTSGTKDSVFFYDAMLGDFRTAFVNNTTDAAPLRTLQGAHDALHDAFLAYRQYRGFREAVALSLVLPPDRPLPKRLARYEEKVAGGYSLRQQVTMVLAIKGYDPRQVTAAIAATAAPLPKPLWSAGYDPYPAWNATFQSLLPAMIDAAGSSDAFLAKVETERTELAARIVAAAKKALGAEKATDKVQGA